MPVPSSLPALSKPVHPRQLGQQERPYRVDGEEVGTEPEPHEEGLQEGDQDRGQTKDLDQVWALTYFFCFLFVQITDFPGGGKQ